MGALPGMIGVLHTFGSDLKYHIHVHCLITFGGLDNQGNWHYPKHKYKIAKYREICSTYKRIFLEELEKLMTAEKVKYYCRFDEIKGNVNSIRWVVHNTRPTIDTKILENYLARYINRVVVSNTRIQYLNEVNEVKLIYNDYKNQLPDKPAPKAYKDLDPLAAIHQIAIHQIM